MSNQLMPTTDIPAHLIEYMNQNGELNNDISEGIQPSFSSLSIRGKVWRIKSGGDEHPILDPNTGSPVGSINAVMVAANNKLSKTYYRAKYQEGSNAEPDCSSENGVTPDVGIENPQSPNCATCPQNVWGSAISEASQKQIKACQDSKRLAIAPVNENGVMLEPLYMLNVPAASLKGLAKYSEDLKGTGRPFQAVVTKMSFDIDAAYPALMFNFARDLTAAEFAQVIEASKKPSTDALVGRMVSAPAAAPAQAQPQVQQPQQAAPVEQVITGFGTVAAPAQAQPQVQQAAAASDPSGLGPDAEGRYWDPEVHSSGKSKVANGTWKKKRGAATSGFESSEPPAVQAATAPQPTQAAAPVVEEVSSSMEAELDAILGSIA